MINNVEDINSLEMLSRIRIVKWFFNLVVLDFEKII